MMKLDGKITICINRDETRIYIEDKNSGVRFLDVELTPDQLSSALSRLANTPCKIKVRGLNKIGKKHEHKTFEFELPKNLIGYDKKKEVAEYSNKICPQGWCSDQYFDSQNSFFQRDGKEWARCTIRRWV
jgi:hypothetical protein